jgi:hypothetical protein
LGQTLPNRLFVSVPVLAMKNRNIDFKSREDAINFGCESVVSMLREFPSLQAQPKCCFVHVHIDTHLFLKLYQQSKREDLFYFLESKQVIES